jgi:hypothetical protein
VAIADRYAVVAPHHFGGRFPLYVLRQSGLKRSDGGRQLEEGQGRNGIARAGSVCDNAEKESPMNLTKEQFEQARSGQPVEIADNGDEFVLIRKDVYERVQAIIPDDLPSIDEQRYMLRSMGEMAGWNDPDMDVYDQP